MKPTEDTYRLFVLALAIWGGAVALASLDGVLAKLSEEEAAALALFAFALATATYFLDRNLRELALPGRAIAGTVVAVDVALVLTALFARELALYFVGPLALAVQVAAVDRALRKRAPTPALSQGRGRFSSPAGT